MAPPARDDARSITKSVMITRKLIDQLPASSHIFFRLHAAVDQSMAFQMAGFMTGQDYTVCIKPDSKEALWRGMRDKTRNVIRRASETLSVRPTSGSDFINFFEQNLKDSGQPNAYSPHALRAAIDAALVRDRGRITMAYDQGGEPQAGIFTVWDKQREYYLLSTRRRSSLSGAISFVIWEALQASSRAGKIFDMDGIHIVGGNSPNLLLLSGFGGQIALRINVKRLSHLGALARGVVRLSKQYG